MWQKIKDWFLDSDNEYLSRSEFLYKPKHIILLLIVLCAVVSVYFIFRKKSEKAKRLFFFICGYVFLAFEILLRIANLINIKNASFESVVKILLPMHFCSVAVWIIMFSIFFNKREMLNVAPIMGLLATTAFLLYPAVGLNAKYLHFSQLYSIFSH